LHSHATDLFTQVQRYKPHGQIARAVYDHSLQLHRSCGVKYIIRQANVDEFMRFRTLFLCATLNLFRAFL